MSLLCSETFVSSDIFDKVINNKIDLDIGTGYDEYCKAIAQSSDETIINHYMHFYPDYAPPILRKGTHYTLFSKMHSIELAYDRINAVFDNDFNFIHISGVYFTEIDNDINRYCHDCMYNNISRDPTEINAFHQHSIFYDSLIASETLTLCNYKHKYWCTICNCFLFTVLCSDTNYCMECEPFITYDGNTNIPQVFFQNEIDFYFSIDSKLYFDE